MTQSRTSRTLHGISVSSGMLLAKSWFKKEIKPVIAEGSITPEKIEVEWERLEQALKLSQIQLEKIRLNLERELDSKHAGIFDFYTLLLEDDTLLEAIRTHLETKLVTAEAATSLAIDEYTSLLLAQDDTYMKSRADDIRDVGLRIISNLQGLDDESNALPDFPQPVILLAKDLTPTETTHLDKHKIAAFVINGGSRTSHTAILARAMGIPAIVAVQEKLDDIPDGTKLELDLNAGTVIVAPDEETEADFERKDERQKVMNAQLASEARQPTETLDGYQASLVANVALPSEAQSVRTQYNVGIGLFRTEFMFIEKGAFLSEEEQFEAYRQTAESIHPYSVIFRTLDIGGDKLLRQLPLSTEINPFMGTRAIRFSLKHPDMFRTQLRAILRASAYGKVRIMFPMISDIGELVQALDYLKEVKAELRSKSIPFNENLDVGCMIEVPSAALLAERLIELVDFFSLGTNDLVQYSMAVDRSNADIAYLYQPAHPAVLRQMKNVVDTALRKGKWVSICGEMAGDPLYTPLLLGMGIQELSMSPVSLAQVHKYIRNIRMYEAEELVRKALQCKDGREVEALCRERIEQ
ncbi:MAG: phosphoenolpyruvate--protein phosphotransferase, partial [Victivallales bacterium]|nr:phosphoenolpyruvate--protein phosphotransferase [Victivallales bacterium]